MSAGSLSAASAFVASMILGLLRVTRNCCCWNGRSWNDCFICVNRCPIRAAGLCSTAPLHNFWVLLLLQFHNDPDLDLSALTSVSFVSIVARRISIERLIGAGPPIRHHDEDDVLRSNTLRTVTVMIRPTGFTMKIKTGTECHLVRTEHFLLKSGTLKTVENAHNTADTKYSVYPVVKITVKSKDRRDSIRN